MIRWLLRLITAAALAVDAFVHADLAATYDEVGTGISQGTLFRAEAAVASLAALLLLVAAHRREVWGFAFLVSLSAFGAVLLYRYVDVGELGPLPNMYEPAWFDEKIAATVAEGVAVLTSLAGLLLLERDRRAAARQ